jgi:hypothetical protein
MSNANRNGTLISEQSLLASINLGKYFLNFSLSSQLKFFEINLFA